MFGSCLGWKVPWLLFATRVVKFRFTSLYDKMAAAHVVLSDNMSVLHKYDKKLKKQYITISRSRYDCHRNLAPNKMKTWETSHVLAYT